LKIDSTIYLRLLNAHLMDQDPPSFAQHAGQLSRRCDSRSFGLVGGSMIYAGQ